MHTLSRLGHALSVFFRVMDPLALSACVLVVSCISPKAVQASWPQFRGVDARGVSENGDLPDQGWTRDDYAWSVDFDSDQVGSPVIAEGQVYVMDLGEESGEPTMDLVAIELKSGETQWRRPHPLTDRRRHRRNTAASTTPVIVGKRIVFCYGDAKGAYLHCYDTEGRAIWSRDLGPWTGYHGFGASPYVFDSTVILFNSQQTERLESYQKPGTSQMMAFHLETGDDLWSKTLTTTRPSYGIPILYQTQTGQSQLIAANTGDGLFGLDPGTGEMLWSLKVFDKRCCSSPVIVGDVAIASCGSGGGGNILSGVRIPQSSDQKPEEMFRMTRSAPYVPTPAVRDGLIFTISDSGIASCLDVEQNGEVTWTQRIGGKFGASPIVVGEDLLLISLDGDAYLGKAGREKPELEEFSLGGPVGATPAVAEGIMVLRVGNQLHGLSIAE